MSAPTGGLWQSSQVVIVGLIGLLYLLVGALYLAPPNEKSCHVARTRGFPAAGAGAAGAHRDIDAVNASVAGSVSRRWVYDLGAHASKSLSLGKTGACARVPLQDPRAGPLAAALGARSGDRGSEDLRKKIVLLMTSCLCCPLSKDGVLEDIFANIGNVNHFWVEFGKPFLKAGGGPATTFHQ